MNNHSHKIFDAKIHRFPVVAVAALEGGLEAATALVQNIPLKSGAAYLFYLQNSEQDELRWRLSAQAKIDVTILSPDCLLQPDTVYIVSGDTAMASTDDALFATQGSSPEASLLSINHFFKSIATACKEFSRGIILSGNGTDGSAGLMHIRERGGTTFAQAPESALFESMPLHAIRSGAADFVMDAEEMGMQLQLLESSQAPTAANADENLKMLEADERAYSNIIDLLHQKTGNDFTHYKQPTIRRRIARRMAIAKISDYDNYVTYLKGEPKELELLFNDILIPVTYFFRDSNLFEMLKREVLPKLLKNKKEKEGIRIWIAGCSTGEEAYSMAIALQEYLISQNVSIKIQIFASDISEKVISKARAGIYSQQEVLNVSEERLAKYFAKIDGSYHIIKEIRDLCVFAVHNFIKDPPFAKLDLLSCRNVLIYLDSYLQKRAFTTFQYALLPTGMLLLGKSESTNHAPGLFDPLVKTSNIFTRARGNAARAPVLREQIGLPSSNSKSKGILKKSVPDFQKAAEDILFNTYTPASVIVNENKEIVHFHGNTGAFLLPPQGKPNFNILKLVRDGLAFEVRAALLEAKTKQNTAIKTAVPIKGMGYFADIEVVPLQSQSDEQHYLVLFRKSVKMHGEGWETEDKQSSEQQRILLLEKEIEQLREDIMKVTEDQEMVHEELQSANEELLSNSEELQTLNEELETSAEQLQSNNEELLAVNEELTDRQNQLVFARLYAEAIIENIREPLVIVDREMRVRSANASFCSHFGSSEKDMEGQIVFDTVLGRGNLAAHRLQIEKSLSEGTNLDNIDVRIAMGEGDEKVMVMNVRPVINNKLGEPIALLAIEDVTELLAANKLLAATNADLAANNTQLASFSSIASHDLQEPLRKISLFCSMVVEGADTISAENSGYLNSIMASTKRMQQLIDDLLLYSKVSSAKASDFAATDLAQLIQDASDELDTSIIQKNAMLIVGEMPALKIISPLVRQVFINLISNAIKYSSTERAPKIQITSEKTIDLPEGFAHSGSNRFLRISVKDNGIGFAPAYAARLFEPFFRLHSQERYEGTGIGLAICKKIMSHHSGYIDCTSESGEGSVFNLYFPIFT